MMINSIDLTLLALATLPLSVKKAPGIPGLFQTMAFAGIFAGAGQVWSIESWWQHGLIQCV